MAGAGSVGPHADPVQPVFVAFFLADMAIAVGGCVFQAAMVAAVVNGLEY